MNDESRVERMVPVVAEPIVEVAEARVEVDLSQGHVIRDLRRQLGMTQEDLAQALGITVGTVSRWEKGRFRPSRLARALILNFARERNVSLHLRPAPRMS